jgi:hypothetical protein
MQRKIMKYVRVLIASVVFIILTAAMMDVPVPGFEGAATSRDVYFKLPLEQPRFHWRFTDREAFLAGRLSLSITSSDGRRQDIVVFDDGAIADGWHEISGPQDDGSMYFGFSSTVDFLTASRDSIEVELVVLEDLHGVGAWNEGVLPAGRYVASASYSTLTGKRWFDWITQERNDPTAYISCWHQTWPLEITRNEGWRGAQEPGQGLTPSDAFARGTDGARCVKG